MTHTLKESLAKLLRLSPDKLYKTTKRLRTGLGGAEWKLSLCLLAAVRQNTFRKLGFATISEYAEEALHLSGKKTRELLGTARALEHLPLMSEAFQKGLIGWGKLRAIRGLVTPETEKEWLDFAMAHHTDEVVRKVTFSPASWKRYQALQASLEGDPVATKEAVRELLYGTDEASKGSHASEATTRSPALETERATECEALSHSEVAKKAVTATLSSSHDPGRMDDRPTVTEEVDEELGKEMGEKLDEELEQHTPTQSRNFFPPSPPKSIRLVAYLTPDEYALYERAEARIRAQAKRRISRAKVLAKMSEEILNAGTARSRAKHLLVVYVDKETGRAWYETQMGPLPVDPSVLEEALKQRETIELEASQLNGDKDSSVSSDSPRDDSNSVVELSSSDDSAQDLRRAGVTLTIKDLQPKGVKTDTNTRDDESTTNGQCDTNMTNAQCDTNATDDQRDGSITNAQCDESTTNAQCDTNVTNDQCDESTSREKSSSGQNNEKTTSAMGSSLTRSRKSGRTAIPNRTLRTLFAQARHRCQRCHMQNALLEVHHTNPLSEGGDNRIETLQVLCRACHSLMHERDYAQKPAWRAAKEAGKKRRSGRIRETVPEYRVPAGTRGGLESRMIFIPNGSVFCPRGDTG